MKTNKSYSKRIRQTSTGKLLTRTPGQDHFNAKERGEGRLNRKRTKLFDRFSNKTWGRFLGRKRVKSPEDNSDNNS